MYIVNKKSTCIQFPYKIAYRWISGVCKNSYFYFSSSSSVPFTLEAQ